MIVGVKVKKLKVNYDQRGHLMEILRRDDKIFKEFGQVYITTARPGIVKAWHYHKHQSDYFCCIYGKIKLVLYDARRSSKTFSQINEFILSLDTPCVVVIPPLVYHGFKTKSKFEAIVVNVPTQPYNRRSPDEYRIDPYKNNIPYDWKK